MTGRLLHLNGPPGVGKSTLAARWADEHPGTLCCDIDVLRTLVGGWRDDWAATGAVVRPVALSMIAAHLAGGRDVVLPQLIANADELARFHRAASDVGAASVLVFLDAPDQVLRRRWRARPGGDAWTAVSASIIEAEGGDTVVVGHARRVRALAATRPDAHVLPAGDGAVEATYAALLALVG